MAGPRAETPRLVPVVPGVVRWSTAEQSSADAAQAFAFAAEGRCVLIDPLPIETSELAQLGQIEAILLTGPAHQRTAFRLRRALGAHVYVPEGAPGIDEAADFEYSAGEALPGGLVAFHAPGPFASAQVLWLTTGPRGVVFLGPLLFHDGSGVPELAPRQEDRSRAHASVQRILDHLPADVLCFGEGPPIVQDGARALRTLLDRLERAGEQPFA